MPRLLAALATRLAKFIGDIATGEATYPAIAAGVADHVWKLDEVIALLDTSA